MTSADAPTLSDNDYRNAMTEVSFLLDILATTVDDLMGGATVSVGRVAGRHQARKLPIYLQNPSVGEVLSALNEYSQLGTKFTFDSASNTLDFSHCAIREVCQARQLELGGNLCRLYHFYLDGVINEFLLRPTRSLLVSTGTCCQAQLEIR